MADGHGKPVHLADRLALRPKEAAFPGAGLFQ
jgi:hypothetical protein